MADLAPEGDDTALAGPRAAIAAAITSLRGFTAAAGSGEMEDVLCALSYLGMAYSALSDDNPAWEDD